MVSPFPAQPAHLLQVNKYLSVAQKLTGQCPLSPWKLSTESMENVGQSTSPWKMSTESIDFLIVRLSLLRKTILIPEYLAFMCVCVFVDGCISQF